MSDSSGSSVGVPGASQRARVDMDVSPPASPPVSVPASPKEKVHGAPLGGLPTEKVVRRPVAYGRRSRSRPSRAVGVTVESHTTENRLDAPSGAPPIFQRRSDEFPPVVGPSRVAPPRIRYGRASRAPLPPSAHTRVRGTQLPGSGRRAREYEDERAQEPVVKRRGALRAEADPSDALWAPTDDDKDVVMGSHAETSLSRTEFRQFVTRLVVDADAAAWKAGLLPPDRGASLGVQGSYPALLNVAEKKPGSKRRDLQDAFLYLAELAESLKDERVAPVVDVALNVDSIVRRAYEAAFGSNSAASSMPDELWRLLGLTGSEKMKGLNEKFEVSWYDAESSLRDTVGLTSADMALLEQDAGAWLFRGFPAFERRGGSGGRQSAGGVCRRNYPGRYIPWTPMESKRLDPATKYMRPRRTWFSDSDTAQYPGKVASKFMESMIWDLVRENTSHLMHMFGCLKGSQDAGRHSEASERVVMELRRVFTDLGHMESLVHEYWALARVIQVALAEAIYEKCPGPPLRGMRCLCGGHFERLQNSWLDRGSVIGVLQEKWLSAAPMTRDPDNPNEVISTRGGSRQRVLDVILMLLCNGVYDSARLVEAKAKEFADEKLDSSGTCPIQRDSYAEAMDMKTSFIRKEEGEDAFSTPHGGPNRDLKFRLTDVLDWNPRGDQRPNEANLKGGWQGVMMDSVEWLLIHVHPFREALIERCRGIELVLGRYRYSREAFWFHPLALVLQACRPLAEFVDRLTVSRTFALSTRTATQVFNEKIAVYDITIQYFANHVQTVVFIVESILNQSQERPYILRGDRKEEFRVSWESSRVSTFPEPRLHARVYDRAAQAELGSKEMVNIWGFLVDCLECLMHLSSELFVGSHTRSHDELTWEMTPPVYMPTHRMDALLASLPKRMDSKRMFSNVPLILELMSPSPAFLASWSTKWGPQNEDALARPDWDSAAVQMVLKGSVFGIQPVCTCTTKPVEVAQTESPVACPGCITGLRVFTKGLMTLGRVTNPPGLLRRRAISWASAIGLGSRLWINLSMARGHLRSVGIRASVSWVEESKRDLERFLFALDYMLRQATQMESPSAYSKRKPLAASVKESLLQLYGRNRPFPNAAFRGSIACWQGAVKSLVSDWNTGVDMQATESVETLDVRSLLDAFTKLSTKGRAGQAVVEDIVDDDEPVVSYSVRLDEGTAGPRDSLNPMEETPAARLSVFLQDYEEEDCPDGQP